MESRSFRMHNGQRGSAMTVKVMTRAKKNEIVEILNDGTVKIRLAVPPDDQKINQVLLEFLAEVLGVQRARLEIVAGQTGTDKLVSVLDLDAPMVQERILQQLS